MAILGEAFGCSVFGMGVLSEISDNVAFASFSEFWEKGGGDEIVCGFG